MTEKFIDLAPQIASMHDQPLGTMRVALGLLDEFASDHPDQVPGRTITNSEIDNHIAIDITMRNGFILGFEAAGGRIVPDPEPTNLELLEDLVDKWRKGPQYKTLTQYLDDCGVKAPGGDDEH